jgi:predicted RNase H-like HicB family nuclease
MKYAVIFEKSRTGCGAYVPDLPGCVAVGKTLKETQRLIREAIELHLQGMREDDEPVPEPTSIADNVTVSASQVASDD